MCLCGFVCLRPIDSGTFLHTIPHILTHAPGSHGQEEGNHGAHFFFSLFLPPDLRVLCFERRSSWLLTHTQGDIVVNVHSRIFFTQRTHVYSLLPHTHVNLFPPFDFVRFGFQVIPEDALWDYRPTANEVCMRVHACSDVTPMHLKLL